MTAAFAFWDAKFANIACNNIASGVVLLDTANEVFDAVTMPLPIVPNTALF